jgi:hypothetical protein
MVGSPRLPQRCFDIRGGIEYAYLRAQPLIRILFALLAFQLGCQPVAACFHCALRWRAC